MDPNTRALIMGAGGGAGTAANYVEDVFSTWLYTGTNATQTITNGIDLSGKGGLVWLKCRSGAGNWNGFYDTTRGATAAIYSNRTDAQVSSSGYGVTAFGSSGFTLGLDSAGENPNGQTCASWTFREQAKFFDVVTYVGDGAATRSISHSLGSAPGFIVVKKTSGTGVWLAWHRSFAQDGSYINLNFAGGTGSSSPAIFTTTVPTSTTFSVSYDSGRNSDYDPNISGATYVAYLFAHDAGGFGDSGNDSIISCGLVTANGSGQLPEVNLGWEPQWILRKRIDYAVNWEIVDNMRGMPPGNGMNSAARLFPNTSGAEDSGFPAFGPTATGFTDGSGFNPNEKIIYIAIRRGPMKTPTDATKVFAQETLTPSLGGSFTTNFPVDLTIANLKDSGIVGIVQDRLRGYATVPSTAGNYPVLRSSGTNKESDYHGISPYHYASDSNASIKYGASLVGSYSNVSYAFRRAPGFFDAVCYTGTGIARTVSHNLGVVPELMIVKKRSAADAWVVYANNDNTDYLVLNTTAATVDDNTIWNDTSPTSSIFTVGTNDDVNGNTATFIAYLFASCPGVSKVGSYTGTGTTLNVDCGFTNGARFVLIKRTDSTGDWYVWDTARGIVSGNDPYLLINSNAAEVTNTDFIDPLSSGFQISSTAPAAVNANGGSYIYLSVA